MQLERKIKVDKLNLGTLGIEGIELKVARLDQLHPVVSGNKLYKQLYFLEDFKHSGKIKIATFGGAFSNHLVATAYASQLLSVPSIGFVRGDIVRNQTLDDCSNYGMDLRFIDRSLYKEYLKDLSILQHQFPEFYFIPEGGYHPLGAKGASLITADLSGNTYSHICTASGTATTLAGLLRNERAEVINVPALKGMLDMEERITHLNGHSNTKFKTWDKYHFGGYAKSTPQLVEFMNWLYREFRLPTDIVYTSKMMFAVVDKIKDGYFPLGSSIMCLHTGGLQGNRSLLKGTLDF